MAGHSVFLDFPRLVTPGVADKWLPRFPCTLEVDCIRGREGKELLKERTKERAKEVRETKNGADDIAFHNATIRRVCRTLLLRVIMNCIKLIFSNQPFESYFEGMQKLSNV